MLKKIIKVSTSWCQPCKQLAPIFEELKNSEEYKNIEFKSVDADEDDEMLCEKYSVRSVPTLILLDENGEQLRKINGFLPKDKLKELIDEVK